MSPTEKARLFRDLAQMARSGILFSKAIEGLLKHAKGDTSAVLQGIRTRLDAGERVAEALEGTSGKLDALEIGIIAAAETSGTLVTGFEYCATYYESIAAARGRIRAKLGYPLFLLHFAPCAVALPLAFGAEGSVLAVLRVVLPQIALIWLVIGAAVGSFHMLLTRAQASLPLDAFLRKLPVLGALRRDFALSRFCSAYHMHLDAGISVYPSLDASARASGSAVLSAATTQASRIVSEGGSVADGIGPSGVFPEDVVRAFYLGEQTGSMTRELTTLVAQYQQSAMRRLDAVAEWIPRLLLIGVYGYIGWTVVQFYMRYFQSITNMLHE